MTFAVLSFLGKQRKVSVGDKFFGVYPSIRNGTVLNCRKVLLIGMKGATMIGCPNILGAYVQLQAIGVRGSLKYRILKKIRRSTYRRLLSRRQRQTLFLVKDISF